MKTDDVLYSAIRTPNMVSDRSADMVFDESYTPDGGVTYPAMSVTKQAFAQECDINYILKNNAMLAPLTPEEYSKFNFLDLGTSIDYHLAKNYLIEAENAFMSLDANIRARFENSPAQFLDFVQNPSNQEELIRMGLATRSTSVSAPAEGVPSAPSGKPTPNAPEEAQA